MNSNFPATAGFCAALANITLQRGKEEAFALMRGTLRGLYLPIAALYEKYPVRREKGTEGGVSGNSTGEKNGWILSSDIGCAFMCLDGLSHYYALSGDGDARKLFDCLAGRFQAVGKMASFAQTHALLSAARGFVRMYRATGEKKYLAVAEDTFRFYLSHGMTLTYENFN